MSLVEQLGYDEDRVRRWCPHRVSRDNIERQRVETKTHNKGTGVGVDSLCARKG